MLLVGRHSRFDIHMGDKEFQQMVLKIDEVRWRFGAPTSSQPNRLDTNIRLVTNIRFATPSQIHDGEITYPVRTFTHD